LDAWQLLPKEDKENLTELKGHQLITADGATGGANVKVLYSTNLFVSLASKDGRTMQFKHKFFIVEGIHEYCFIGEDLLGSSRKLYETPDTVTLTTNTQRKFNWSEDNKDGCLFHIPIYRQNKLSREPNLTISKPFAVMETDNEEDEMQWITTIT
jgi:hypothetical protein